MKKILITLVLFITHFSIAQPIKIEDVVSENRWVSFNSQKLILLDFWATWCAPCVSATQQLEILQERNTDKIFMISISDEHSSRINKYLEKKDISIMVVTDKDNYTFSLYNVTQRPYAVVLNNDGEILFKGHPADFTQRKLDDLHRNETKVISKKNFAKWMHKNNDDNYKSEKVIVETFTINDAINEEDTYYIDDDIVHFIGQFKNLYLELKKCYPFEISFESEDLNKKIKITANKNFWKSNSDEILQNAMNHLHLQGFFEEIKINAKEIKTSKDELLWDDKQYNWEGSAVNFIAGNDRIQADNVSVEGLAKILSNVKQQPFIYSGKNKDVHDWDFHYLYDDLMIQELKDSFGIYIKDSNFQVNVYKIYSTKKE